MLMNRKPLAQRRRVTNTTLSSTRPDSIHVAQKVNCIQIPLFLLKGGKNIYTYLHKYANTYFPKKRELHLYEYITLMTLLTI